MPYFLIEYLKIMLGFTTNHASSSFQCSYAATQDLLCSRPVSVGHLFVDTFTFCLFAPALSLSVRPEKSYDHATFGSRYCHFAQLLRVLCIIAVTKDLILRKLPCTMGVLPLVIFVTDFDDRVPSLF